LETIYYHTLIKYQQRDNSANLSEYITAKVKLFNINFGFHSNSNRSPKVTNRLIAMPDKNVRSKKFV
jgi:hypothetical protein